MREIFVFEFFSGGGLWLWPGRFAGRQVENLPHGRQVTNLPHDLVREGSLMRDALVADFGRLPQARVTTLQDARFASPNSAATIVPVADKRSFWIELERTCRRADYVLLVAPECDGWLLRLAAAVEAWGTPLLSPGSHFISWAADKNTTADVLRNQRAPYVPGISCESWLESGTTPTLAFPVVLKPCDGAGSLGVRHVEGPVEFQALLRSGMIHGGHRCEQFCPGRSGSIVFVCGPRSAHCLRPCWQHMADDGSYRYTGGEIMRHDAMAERAQRLVEPLQSIMQSAVGMVGVDFVLGEDPSGRLDVIIEVNPRVTTSYIGLRRYYGCNLAQAMIDVAEGRPVDFDRQVHKTCSGWHWTLEAPISKRPTVGASR